MTDPCKEMDKEIIEELQKSDLDNPADMEKMIGMLAERVWLELLLNGTGEAQDMRGILT